jgi:hypothetical protein
LSDPGQGDVVAGATPDEILSVSPVIVTVAPSGSPAEGPPIGDDPRVFRRMKTWPTA